jgi:heterodisulfide reductase subunit A-like polyferredoxin
LAKFNLAGSQDKVLVVGGGAAGLEATLALGKRDYEIILAESDDTLSGRVVVFDDEHYYRASAIAEKIQIADAQVI